MYSEKNLSYSLYSKIAFPQAKNILQMQKSPKTGYTIKMRCSGLFRPAASWTVYNQQPLF